MTTQNNGNMMSAFASNPLFAGVYAAGIDFFLVQRSSSSPDMMTSVKFGLSVAGGTAIGDLVADKISDSVGMGTLVQRVGEIAAGSVSSYLINKYIIQNDIDMSTPAIMKKVAIIGASQLLATYTTEYMTSQPLHYFM